MIGSVTCRYCRAPILFIETRKGRQTPVGSQEFTRQGLEALPPGRYFSDSGDCYDAAAVPAGLIVFRSHWSDCPGADKARKK